MGVVLLAALLITAGTWLLARLSREHEQESQPICALCGYSLRGSLSTQCSECGSFSEHAIMNALKIVRWRLRLGWTLIVFGVLTLAIWRLQIFEPTSSSILSGAVKLIPRSGDYEEVLLSFLDVDGRLSSAPQYAQLQVVAQSPTEELVALDAVRAESDWISSREAGSWSPDKSAYVRLCNILTSAAPEAPISEISLDAADLMGVIGNGISCGDPWASCQNSSRFICQPVVVVRSGSIRFTLGLLIAILAAGIAWYLGQRFVTRRIIMKMKAREWKWGRTCSVENP